MSHLLLHWGHHNTDIGHLTSHHCTKGLSLPLDVRLACIVLLYHPRGTVKYVALSYVWGRCAAGTAVSLTSNTHDHLRTEGCRRQSGEARLGATCGGRDRSVAWLSSFSLYKKSGRDDRFPSALRAGLAELCTQQARGGAGRRYGIRIPKAANAFVASNLKPDYDGVQNGVDEGGDNEGADIDADDIGIEIPDAVPEEHWPDYEDFKDDLQKVIDLLRQTNVDKKAAEAKVKYLEARVAELEAGGGGASAAEVADLKKERDRYKKLYEDEAEKNRPPRVEYVQVPGPERVVYREVPGPERVVYREVPGPERIVYRDVPGPERVVYQHDPKLTKALHEIAAYRSVAWSYHPLNEQVEEAVRNGTYLPPSAIY
ncbi:hypothetical protein QBC43DRAFT_367733 [Cladorrhinum sp. PSN259]|nr:hypothetical protein QBC43DRAFT_367733 [Cladorrhinum sp. PSN259]